MQAQVTVNTSARTASARPIFAEGGVSQINAESGAPATLDILDIPGRRVKKIPLGDWRQPAEQGQPVLRCCMN